MPRWGLKVLFVAVQVYWMLVVLPGHVRGRVVMGPDRGDEVTATAGKTPSCCADDPKPSRPDDAPSQDRKNRCAVCYQAHGYTLPPVYAFDILPTGFCELCRLIEPGKRHRLLCDPVYFANGPPACFA